MEIKVNILRKKKGDENSYWQTFIYEYEDENENVATLLTNLNSTDKIIDANGNETEKIIWECNCLQKKCGACAMVINKKPQLACGVLLKDVKGDLTLEPLKKFPIICDLMVDRKILFDNLKDIKMWFEDDAKISKKSLPVAYESSRCLKCGCCLEVCPNFSVKNTFGGMALAVPYTRLLSMIPESQKKEAGKLYRKHVFEGCGKSLACRDICPADIDIEEMIVNSNAVAVWKRYLNK